MYSETLAMQAAGPAMEAGAGVRFGRALAAATPVFSVHQPDDPGRGEVEAFIRCVYADHFGARVRQFAPTLVSLREGGVITAAAGYRSGVQPLFLEHYLDGPVERLLAGPGERLPRERIFEVGHLAALQPGEGRRLIPFLARHLEQLQVQWVVSTATQELRRIFTRLGVKPITLGAADPARLGAGAVDWGRYYDHRPLVLAGRLPVTLRSAAPRRAAVGE
jgi:hypothetical protein